MNLVGVYYGRHRDDLLEGEGFEGRDVGPVPLEFVPLNAQTTHFGGLVLGADSVLVLNGILTTDKPPRGKVIMVKRRARDVARHRNGRSRRRRWTRMLGPVPFDTPEHLGELVMQGTAVVGLNAAVISPNVVLGELILVGDAAFSLTPTRVLAVAPGQGLAMVGDAAMTAAGTEIFAGVLKMVGDAAIRLRGTGGNNASLDPTERRGGIISIGIRGGHS